MNRSLIIALLLIIAAGLSTGCQVGGAETPVAQPTSIAQPGPTALPPTGGSLEAEARVVPVQSAALSLPVGGIVAELPVAEGDKVEAGQLLLRLDQSRSAATVAQAEADLAKARAAYEQLSAGATPEDIAAAEAAVAQSQAELRQVRGSVTASDVEAAQAQLEQARAALASLQGGPDDTALRQAQAALDQAQAGYQTQRDALSAAKSRAQSQIEQAANTLRDRQEAYSTIYWQNRELDKAPGELPQQNRDQEAAALRAVQSAEEALRQAQLAYDQAKEAEVSGLAAAEAQVRDAQARLDKLLAGSSADQLAAARAQVAAGQANLDKLNGAQQGGAVEAAQAGVAQAEARLARLRAGTSQSDLAIAAAEVQRAEAALKLAQVAQTEAELHAPFAGTVVTVMPKVGEYVTLGTPIVQLADLTTWQIETTDLTEQNVVRVHERNPVTIQLDALPDLDLSGRVSRIRALGENQQGDITYVVTIALDRQDPQLRWNMTASVLIEQ